MKKMDKTPKKILDMTCGPRSIWFNKAHPLAVYCDIREGDFQKDFGKAHGGVKNLHVHPDVIADFRDLPFPDDSFNLVVFDPPHASRFTESSWLINAYGKLEDDWRDTIRAGVDEAMRVLVPYGTLVFKWAEVQFTTREVINAIGREPLFGHRSGKKSGTHWMVFMKIPKEENND